MLNRNLSLAWQLFRQSDGNSETGFLRVIQAILLVFIITLSQTSQSIQDFLAGNLANLLGADLVLSQQQPLTPIQRNELLTLSDQLVLTQTLPVTLTHLGSWQRAKLKAVGKGYPLQGQLKTTDTLGGKSQNSLSGPKPGEVWLDSRLMASLSLLVGEQISLSNKAFTVSKILLHEPDRLMEGHNVDMRAMINSADMASLHFAEDLIEHRYLVAAAPQQVKQIIAWQKTQLPAAQLFHKQGAHPLALFWQRTENVIGLASIILFFMAAIAIEQLSHRQINKEQRFAAICMSVGASRSTVVQMALLKWAMNFLMCLPAVLLVSALCHWLIVVWLGNTFSGLNWQWSWLEAVQSVLATALIFAIFQAPIWYGAAQSSVRQLVQNNGVQRNQWLSGACALLVISALALVYSDNGLLTTMVLTAMAISIGLILCLSWALLTVSEKATQGVSGLLPFALYMMKQRLVSKSTQILGVGLCAFLLLFTLMLLKDLGGMMQSYTRQHDGNLLVSQASAPQMQAIKAWAKQHQANFRQSKPYMYAKLTQINGQPLADFTDKPSDSLATFSRAIRLHWTQALPSNNSLEKGQWWSADDSNWQQVSVEQEVLTDLGLQVGDSLTFYIGQQRVDFKISASHVYKPGAGSITFWVQMPPQALAHIHAPQYHMASLELNKQQFAALGQLWQQHPSLRMQSLQEITARFDTTLAMVTQVISGFSVLIIILAGIVIAASVHGLEAREKKKNSIIMSFGFNRQTCLKLNAIEWAITGLIAASGAIAGTCIAGLLIYQSQFSMPYQPDVIWLLGTLLVILMLVMTLGISASKNSLSSSVRELLAE